MSQVKALAAALALLTSAATPIGPASASSPPRIVSLNPCLDAIVLDVADPGQILALSRYSQRPSEFAMAGEARRYRHIAGAPEEVAALRPDLVLESGMAGEMLAGAMKPLGIASAGFSVPSTVAESLDQVRKIAALAGHPQRGERLAARIEAALRDAAPPPGSTPLTALVFEERGLASGPDTLMDELMRRTGFVNVAPRYGLRHTGVVPLERLLAAPPQVLLSGRLDTGEPSWADRTLSHPALRSLRGRMRVEAFPQALLYCAGPVLIPAAEALGRARRDAETPAR